MKDPLHFSQADLTASYNGKSIVLNKRLLDQQNAWGNLEQIKTLHIEKLKLYELINKTNDSSTLKSIDQLLTDIEFQLQEAWGFAKDKNFHRFWERPKCSCPSIDNRDDYPYQQYVSADCPLHGRQL